MKYTSALQSAYEANPATENTVSNVTYNKHPKKSLPKNSHFCEVTVKY